MRTVDLTRRRSLRLLALAAAGTALLACGSSPSTAQAPAKGKEAPTTAKEAAGAEGEGESARAKELWLKSGGDDLLKGRTFQTLFNALPDRMRALELKDTNLRCIDEGVPGGIHMAGSGVLYEATAAELKGKIAGIYTHDGCGAAKLYVEQQKIKTDDPDSVADERARLLAEKMGVPFLGRIKASQMTRPKGFHVARAVYYDGTGKLDPAQLPGMPQGFMVSRRYISDVSYAKAEVDVAIGIALGADGFGPLFTSTSPFYLVGVTGLDKDSVPAQALATELKALAEPFPNVAVHILDVGPNGATADPARTVIKAAAPSAAAPKEGAAARPGAAPGKEAAKPETAPGKEAAKPAAPGKEPAAPGKEPAAPGKEPAAPGKEPAKAGAAAGKEPVKAGAAPGNEQRPSFGPAYLMKDRIVNLADPGGRRYLRFSVAVEFEPPAEAKGGGEKSNPDKEFQAAIKKYVPAIEDAVTMVLSSKTFEDLRTGDGKEQAKREIRAVVQEALIGAETVTAIFFTDFVVQ